MMALYRAKTATLSVGRLGEGSHVCLLAGKERASMFVCWQVRRGQPCLSVGR